MDGKRHGKGTLERRDGSSYEGEWRSDRRNGQGTETYVNRDVYSGKWVADKPSGRGRYVYAAGHSYEGIWSDGMRMGKVRLRTAGVRPVSLSSNPDVWPLLPVYVAGLLHEHQGHRAQWQVRSWRVHRGRGVTTCRCR